MTIRRAVAAVALVGAAIAAYLTYVHYAHVAPICTTGGCEKVQTSKYAELVGIPVAVLGLVAYVAVLALTFVRHELAAAAATLVALIGVGFSAYLLWAQLGPIDAICQWCIANDVTVTVLAALCVAWLLREPV